MYSSSTVASAAALLSAMRSCLVVLCSTSHVGSLAHHPVMLVLKYSEAVLLKAVVIS